MGISNGAVIVIAIVVAGFVVITGAVIFKFGIGRGDSGGEENEYYNQRSNDQEHYSKYPEEPDVAAALCRVHRLTPCSERSARKEQTVEPI